MAAGLVVDDEASLPQFSRQLTQLPRHALLSPSDVSHEERGCVAPSLGLMRRGTPRRTSDPREVFDALRRIACSDTSWRFLPTHFPPWVVARSFAWAVRFRRLARDNQLVPETVAGLHFVAFRPDAPSPRHRHGPTSITGSHGQRQTSSGRRASVRRTMPMEAS